jgi:hypothetical protein
MVEEAGKSKLVLLSNPGDCLHLGLVWVAALKGQEATWPCRAMYQWTGVRKATGGVRPKQGNF